jgi:hypothetical protein
MIRGLGLCRECFAGLVGLLGLFLGAALTDLEGFSPLVFRLHRMRTPDRICWVAARPC